MIADLTKQYKIKQSKKSLKNWLTFPSQSRVCLELILYFKVTLHMEALGNYFMEVVKDNISFFYLITSQIITWQFSKQLGPVVIIYCCRLVATPQEIP